jgi:hypothetical protein
VAVILRVRCKRIIFIAAFEFQFGGLFIMEEIKEEKEISKFKKIFNLLKKRMVNYFKVKLF